MPSLSLHYKDIASYLMPGEDPVEFEDLLIELEGALNPQGYLEDRQIELIALCDWEIRRHHRLNSSLLWYETRRQQRRLAPTSEEAVSRERQELAMISAQVYTQFLTYHAHHEEAVAHAERRRQKLLNEFYDLQKLRKAGEVEDAEVLET